MSTSTSTCVGIDVDACRRALGMAWSAAATLPTRSLRRRRAAAGGAWLEFGYG